MYSKIYSVGMIHYREIYFPFLTLKIGILFGFNILTAMPKYGDYCLLEYDAVYSGRNSSTFCLPPLSRLNSLFNTKHHYFVHNSTPLDLILCQMSPIHTLPPYSLKILLDMIVARLLAGRPEFYSRQGKKSVYTAQRLNLLLAPPSLQSSGYRGLYPRD
jgi:hypothetical protein